MAHEHSQTIGTQYWFTSLNGNKVLIDNPSQCNYDPFEIAVVLSRLPRYAGHSSVNYTVAEHSMNCLNFLEESEYDFLGPYVILHDAVEAYTGYGDAVSPFKWWLKYIVGYSLSDFEKRILLRISDRFELDYHQFFNPKINECDLKSFKQESDLMIDTTDWEVKFPDFPEPKNRLFFKKDKHSVLRIFLVKMKRFGLINDEQLANYLASTTEIKNKEIAMNTVRIP